VYLHDRGFRLIDIDTNQPRYARDRTGIPALADRRLVYAGDAYFMLDPERAEVPPRDLYRMGAVAVALGFYALGLSLIRESQVLSSAGVEQAEAALARVPRGRWLKSLWNQVPLKAAQMLKRLR